MSLTDAIGGASSSVNFWRDLEMLETKGGDKIESYLEFSNMDSRPKSDAEPLSKEWFIFAFVGTIGISSGR